MKTKNTLMITQVKNLCDQLVAEFDLIPLERKDKLLKLRDYIQAKYKENTTPHLIVICTHNSRRSHIGQIWLSVAAEYYTLPKVNTFSGGTEATAFNPRAVKALQNLGFQITTNDEQAENPRYQVIWNEDMKAYIAFSKKYDDMANPQENFAAIMVCNEADAGCPVVSGCDYRLALPYNDPKSYDGTALEEAKYEERARQIGREILYVYSQIS